jgi:hypothetical protein
VLRDIQHLEGLAIVNPGLDENDKDALQAACFRFL